MSETHPRRPMKLPRKAVLPIAALAFVIVCAAWLGGGGLYAIRHCAFAQYLKAELEPSRRDGWQMPDKVIGALEIHSGEKIADLGAGNGYFALRFAAAGAFVCAVDIDKSALDYLARDAKRQRLAVVTRLAQSDDPGLSPASVDLVFICDTYHHIRSSQYLRKLAPALAPGGRVAIVDFKKDPNIEAEERYKGRISREQVLADFNEAGYTLEKEYDFLPKQYFMVFAPRRTGGVAK